MKNRTLAIFGIGTYILSVLTSISDLDGNPLVPDPSIVISGIALLLFTVMAIVRLWKSARNLSIIFASSTIIVFILGVIQEITLPSYGSPIIIMLNIINLIDVILFVWVITKLFKMKDSDTSTKEIPQFAHALRWLAVIPGAFFFAVLVMFPIHWGVVLIHLFSRSNMNPFVTLDGNSLLAAIPPELLERLAYVFFTPLVVITVGAKISPKFKFQTGVALAILEGTILGTGLVLVFSKNQYIAWPWWRFVMTSVLGIAGISLGLFRVHKAQNKEGVPLSCGGKPLATDQVTTMAVS